MKCLGSQGGHMAQWVHRRCWWNRIPSRSPWTLWSRMLRSSLLPNARWKTASNLIEVTNEGSLLQGLIPCYPSCNALRFLHCTCAASKEPQDLNSIYSRLVKRNDSTSIFIGILGDEFMPCFSSRNLRRGPKFYFYVPKLAVASALLFWHAFVCWLGIRRYTVWIGLVGYYYGLILLEASKNILDDHAPEFKNN